MKLLTVCLLVLTVITACTKSEGEVCVDLYNAIGQEGLGDDFSAIKHIESKSTDEGVRVAFGFEGAKKAGSIFCKYRTAEDSDTWKSKALKFEGEDVFDTFALGGEVAFFHGWEPRVIKDTNSPQVFAFAFSKEGEKINGRWRIFLSCDSNTRNLDWVLNIVPPSGVDISKHYESDSMGFKFIDANFHRNAMRSVWTRAEVVSNSDGEIINIDLEGLTPYEILAVIASPPNVSKNIQYSLLGIFELLTSQPNSSRGIQYTSEEIPRQDKYGNVFRVHGDEFIEIQLGNGASALEFNFPAYNFITQKSLIERCVQIR